MAAEVKPFGKAAMLITLLDKIKKFIIKVMKREKYYYVSNYSKPCSVSSKNMNLY